MITDIQKEAYELSSNLFSFKDMRRGVIEHGKTCYIEGYKKHDELFSTFLVKNGYFSEEELHRISAEFEASLTNKPVVSVRYAEDMMTQLFPCISSPLTNIQKDIVDLYCGLTNEINTLCIYKMRQKGVSTICKILAYIEALNDKRVLYCGFEKCDKVLKGNKNITYRELHCSSNSLASFLCGKRFDLIIIDEVGFIKYEPEYLEPSLNEGGRVILSQTYMEQVYKDSGTVSIKYKDKSKKTMVYQMYEDEANSIR